ncbi:hypothetical protein HSX11_26020 [Oxalobacteraceae bacterium]|nr:hypothetical protein [Oxalobacteraceae bacterium]
MTQTSDSASEQGGPGSAADPRVRHLRQILLWPLRLIPAAGTERAHLRPWDILRAMGSDANAGVVGQHDSADPGAGSPWREVVDEYDGDVANFHERHYNEFVAFLPYVQRFLYGEGRTPDNRGSASPMRVFRRRDIAQVRVIRGAGDAPLTLDIVHIDLYFFYDVDVVMLNVEVCADELPLSIAQDLLYRFGRAYPAGWDPSGQPLHCLHSVEWLDAGGRVLAASEAQQKEAILLHAWARRAPSFASHWKFLLEPLVHDLEDQTGVLRYQQIEYYRMPMMAYLAVDHPRALSRRDFIRLGLVTGAGMPGTDAAAHDGVAALPFSEQYLDDFERQYCYDRFWSAAGAAPHTRYLCSGHALVVVGDARSDFYRCRDRGVLAQFRHQHFLLFLIAHLQKASLLMFSDRLAEALNCLNVGDADNVRRFKRKIRASFEGFLRFTHRYWFHEISEQAQVRALFHMCSRHLDLDRLHAEVKVRMADMNAYLDADSLRRQANTVVRLTVVTIFGLIGTVTTGFLGMNLLAEADAPLSRRLWIFGVTAIITVVLTSYTMVKSKRLSDFLDALSDERLSAWAKIKSFAAVWRKDAD